MRRVAAALLLAATAAPAMAADTLVVTLSADEVRIESNFTGTGITVFGAIESDQPARIGTDVELAIILEGPPETIVTRRKERVLGLWINRAEATFPGVPEFYAVHSSAPLADISERSVLRALRVGIANLPLVTSAGWEAAQFRAALVRLKQEQGHFVEAEDSVENPGGSVFRSTFDLPADIPVGDYKVSVLLFRGGALTASAETTLSITKSGAEQFLYDASRNMPWAYALVVVLLGGAIGWLAGAIFRRD